MKTIKVYTEHNNYECILTTNTLDELNINYTELPLLDHEINVITKTSESEVLPQIFIGNIYIGGYYELEKLIETGELYNLIKTQ